ncbi:MAG: hypothetical protein R3F15_13670 [Lysobacterales bacterium]
MRDTGLALALCCWFAIPAFAGTLSVAEADSLRAEVATIATSFEHGDAEVLIARTHPSLHDLVGGQEAFAKATHQAVEQLRQAGVKFISAEVGTPTQTYTAGDEELCFVPRVSVMEVQGQKVKSTTFMMAIRRVGTGDWKYLDGAGLRKHPELLYQLFPKLERGISLPLNTIEVL